MKFCEDCDSMLKTRFNKEINKREYVCKCGKTYEFKPESKVKSKFSKKQLKDFTNLRKTIVIDDNYETLDAVIKQICPKCENDKAYLFEMPPLYGDEDNVVRYKCTKCNYTYSDGGKIR